MAVPLIAVAIHQVHSCGSTADLEASRPRVAGDAGAPSNEPARRVQVVEIGYGHAAMEATYPGTVRAAQTAALAFRVGGPLVEVRVKPGDTVRCGDVVMRIDPRDFESAVHSAAATLDSARAKLSAMKRGARQEDILAMEARMESAAARRTYLQAAHERSQRLVQTNAIPRDAFEASESELAAVVAEIRALEQELHKARTGARPEDIEAMEADIRGMEASLKNAEDRLADTSLQAPFDAIVARRCFENHEQVQPGQTAVVLHDLARLKIDVALPDKELLHRPVLTPLRAAVRFVSLSDGPFEAVLEEISTEADPATGTYLATFGMPAPADFNAFPGMLADVVLPSHAKGEREGALMVPATAVRGERDGSRFVWVVSNGVAQWRKVVLGGLSACGRYEAISGLSAGDRVVTGGSALLHDGARVEVAGTEGGKRHEQLTWKDDSVQPR